MSDTQKVTIKDLICDFKYFVVCNMYDEHDTCNDYFERYLTCMNHIIDNDYNKEIIILLTRTMNIAHLYLEYGHSSIYYDKLIVSFDEIIAIIEKQ